jgi:glycosyltransferase involved in cell wall biosynthesis
MWPRYFSTSAKRNGHKDSARQRHAVMTVPDLIRSQRRSADMRHICLVTETYLPELNGVALTLARLTEGLRSQGYAVSVVRPSQKSVDASGSSYDPMDIQVPGLPLPGYKGLRFGLPAGGVLVRSWSQRRPDAVYVATEGPLGWSAVRSAQRLSIPVFSGFHTNFHSYSRHYHAGWLSDLIFRYLCRFHNHTRGTLVPSAELREQLRARGIANVAVLGRGVDCRLFTPDRRCTFLRRAWGATENDLVALYVGRLAAEKNLGLAVESYRAMQRINGAAKFVLVGDGPQRSSLQKQHPDLIFCGEQTGESLARHYASADVFLFPSETETFGNVTLEAMASGLCVVAYDYAAAHLHLRRGESGLLAPLGDSWAFVAAAAQLAGDPLCLSAMRRQARAHALSLDWRRVVEQFAALLLGAFAQENSTAAADDASELLGATPA